MSIINAASDLTNCSSLCPTAHDDSSSDNEFSAQNLVGIFLTLSLCLLTQPYGSLFYNPPSSKPSQRLFFTWRLNPLACIAETAVIIVSLVLVLRLAMQDPEHNTLPSVSRRFPFYHARTERSRNWKRHWHLHAAALLLIRANEEGVDGGVLDRLMAESLLRDGPGEELESGVSTAREVPDAGGGGEDGRDGAGIELAVMERSTTMGVNAGESNAHANEAAPVAGSATGAENTYEPQLGVLRRRTSQLEAGLPADPEPQADTTDSGLDSDVTTHGQDRLADLRKVLGNNVLAHKEKWVNLVTSFSVLGVAIKLAATTLPWTVRVPAAFFLAGWSSVQFLLYLFHLGELDERSAGTVLKTIRLHRQLARDTVIQRWMRGVVALVVAPPVLWLGYCAGFPGGDLSTFWGPIGLDNTNSTNMTSQNVSMAYTLYQIPLILPWLFSYFAVGLALLLLCSSALMAFPVFLAPLCGIRDILEVQQLEDCNYRVILLMIASLAISVGVGIGGIGAFKVLSQVEGVVRFFNGLIGAGATVGTCFVFFGLLAIPSRLVEKEDHKTSDRDGFAVGLAALINTLICLYLFSVLVDTYNSDGTYKPAWLEYLG